MKIISAYLLMFLVLLLTACSDTKSNPGEKVAAATNTDEMLNPSPNVIPAIQEWHQGRGFFELKQTVSIQTNHELKAVAQTFAQDIEKISGIALAVNNNSHAQNKIVLSLDIKDKSLGKEGYTIDIEDNVYIKANSTTGVFYATQTLLQILAQDENKSKLPKGNIRDFPKIQNRQFMIDLGRKYFSMDYLKTSIRNMAWYKLNAFHLHFTDWSGFRLQSDKYPGLASKQSYSKEELRELQDYAAKYHVMIIPEIDLPAHATHILNYNANLGLSCDAMQTAKWLPKEKNDAKVGWMLDITRPEVREFIQDLFQEFLPLFDAPVFFIGGDEWQYDNQKEACPELVAYAKQQGYQHTGDVFVEWINEINTLVKSHGKTTHIWNWWRFSPSAKLKNVTDTQPDKDIVISVWNKLREASIIEDGYSVILTPEEGAGALYSTPGLNGTKPGDYGYFDSKNIYEKWQPKVSAQIKGYKVCLWSDGAEEQPEAWFDQHIESQKAVFSEKMWGVQGSTNLAGFIDRKKQIGYAPSAQ